MKTFLKILTFLWISFWLFFSVIIFQSSSRQIEKDKIFIEKMLKPSVDFIENFKLKNNRIPNNLEYYTWRRQYYNEYRVDLTKMTDSLISTDGPYIRSGDKIVIGKNGVEDLQKISGADWTKDYAIRAWRGEWNEYYFSWSKSYIGNSYSKKDGLKGILIGLFIGFAPLLFWVRPLMSIFKSKD